MKIFSFLSILVFAHWICASLFAQTLTGEYQRFQGQSKSLIQWNELDPLEWTSFERWKNATILKDKQPDWEVVVRERNVRSLMGRVLDCVGDCRLYKTQEFTRLRFRSALYQGDEITTGKDSYLWLFLLDGTMVRLSPDSSITMRELNIGKSETLLHARLNAGNILWISRSESPFIEENLRETDSLFKPLYFFEANPLVEQDKDGEDNFLTYLSSDKTVVKQIQRLNKLITENNEWTKKRKTYSFLVMPNGSVGGYDLQAEFIVLIGGESFVKRRGKESLRHSNKSNMAESYFYYRGFDNRDEFLLTQDQWYKINPTGRNISLYDAPSLYGMGEYITRRIPTIYVARELMMRRYSKFMFEDLSPMDLAEKHGFLKWGELSNANDDLAQRLSFIKEHTRRTETMQLLTSERFKQRVLEERGEVLESMVYSDRFFRKALVNFKLKREIDFQINPNGETLNSTKKKLWSVINARKQRQLSER